MRQKVPAAFFNIYLFLLIAFGSGVCAGTENSTDEVSKTKSVEHISQFLLMVFLPLQQQSTTKPPMICDDDNGELLIFASFGSAAALAV
jgi:hypothetical protein